MSAGKQGAARAVEEKTVDVGEYKVNVASAGSGPAIVMLHGEEKRPSWKDWEGFLGLADGYRLIIPDLVGFGKSSRPAETPDYRAQARVVHELLDVLKVDKAALAGYSWAGKLPSRWP